MKLKIDRKKHDLPLKLKTNEKSLSNQVEIVNSLTYFSLI